MHLTYPAVLSALLFAVGLYGVLARRNAVLVLAAVELMLTAVTLNLVAFDAWWADQLHAGQVLTLFVITLAAAEIGVGLAIVLLVFRLRGTTQLDELTALRTDGGAHDGAYGDGAYGDPDAPVTPGADDDARIGR